MSSPAFWTLAGGGLAGTLLAWEFHKRGQPFDWYADPHRPASSCVAAGMYNPITGKRFAKTWQIETLQPFMESYYRDIEKGLNTRFLFPKPALKLFKDQDEKDRWTARKHQKDYQRLAHPLPPSFFPKGIRVPDLGGFIVPSAGFVRVDLLLKAVHEHLSRFVQKKPEPLPQGLQGQNVIHCTGWFAHQNPDFKGLPLRHAHGDVLTIKPSGPVCEDFILNCGFYMLPLGDNTFRVGATYDWNRLDPAPTPEGKQQLIEKLSEWITVSFDVIEHEAGIRPTTVRRTPLLGRLPDDPHTLLFNGLGSKGILNAPYYASQLADHLLLEKPLDREVDIRTHLRIGVDSKAKA